MGIPAPLCHMVPRAHPRPSSEVYLYLFSLFVGLGLTAVTDRQTDTRNIGRYPALEVFFINDMRDINPRFTYLLTYLTNNGPHLTFCIMMRPDEILYGANHCILNKFSAALCMRLRMQKLKKITGHLWHP